MPTVPAFVAQRMEHWMGIATTVTAIEPLTPHFRLVRFGGEGLRGRAWTPGQVVEIRVSERDFRHYTPISYHRKEGELEILFHLNKKGPGSAWVERLTHGQTVFLLGPGESFSFHPNAAWSLFLGDETALGLLLALQHNYSGRTPLQGIIAVDAAEQEEITTLFPRITILGRTDTSSEKALAFWLNHHPLSQGSGIVYLVGHAQSIQQLRFLLQTSFHLEKKQIKTKPYWADGKCGL